ncbi:hypothetical protein ACLB2K_035236 [Fragaria x ananassa]
MKFVTSISQNKEIKESLDSLNSSSNPILGLAHDNPLESKTAKRMVNPFTELLDDPRKLMLVQTSIYSNYITIGLKFLNYKKYHLHAFVDTGSGSSVAKRYVIPEEYWEKSPRTVTGVAMEENNIVMDTMARNVQVSLGRGTFTIKIMWQCEGQTADLLIRNDFLLQQTVIQTPKMIGFEKHKKYYWKSRLTDAVRVTSKGFTDQYQRSPAKSGDYQPILKPVLLLYEQLKGHKEILVNEETSSEDSESEESSEYQISDNESSDGEEEYIREHNLRDKNYLPDALTREIAMFDREGRNPRSRKPVSEEKKLWERYKSGDKTVGHFHDGPEKLAQEFLLCPKGTASTNRSQGKRPASPSQRADGKGISSPLMAAALPKSRRDPLRASKIPIVTGKKVIHDQSLKIFQKPVFRTERLLPFKQKIIIDNILYSFYEENEAHLLQTLKALTKELHGFHTKDKDVPAENQAGSSKAVYLENPESAKIPMLALKESEWYKFHNLLGEGKDVLPRTLSVVPGPYYGKYMVDVQAEHPQKHKLWLVKNSFVHNLWTKTNEDLKGLPEIIAEAVKNIRPDGCILRLKFISTQPEWTVVNNQMNYISPYHHVRLIQSPVQKTTMASGNERPNQSIPWMKAMTIVIIKDVVLRDYDSSLLASGEKIMVTCYNHPPPENCDFFTALMRKEVDCTLASTTWLEKVETEDKYKISYPYDSDLDNGDEDTARDWEYSGPNSSVGYSEDPETYHNIMNMLEN